MAIATTIENAVLAQAQAVAETAGLDTTYNPGTATEIIPFLVDARKALRDMGAPETGLVAALSTSRMPHCSRLSRARRTTRVSAPSPAAHRAGPPVCP